MKAFNYRLQSLLEIRDKSREKALEEYGLYVKKRVKIEENCQQIEKQLELARKQLAKEREVNFSAVNQNYYFSSLQNVSKELEQEKELLEEAVLEEDIKKKNFLKAKSEADILEKLKIKKKQQHLYTENLKEEKAIDDIINSRLINNSQ